METAVRFDPLPRSLPGDPRFQALPAKMKRDDWKRKVAAIILLPALVALVASGCAAVGPPIQKQCFHANESSEKDIGYCQAVRVGNTLYIAGTAGEGDMASAIR